MYYICCLAKIHNVYENGVCSFEPFLQQGHLSRSLLIYRWHFGIRIDACLSGITSAFVCFDGLTNCEYIRVCKRLMVLPGNCIILNIPQSNEQSHMLQRLAIDCGLVIIIVIKLEIGNP